MEEQLNKEDAGRLRCTLPNGSARSTERKYMRRYKRHFRYLLWNRAQVEEGGDGAGVQQRRRRKVEMHFAKWIGEKHREEVHEKIHKALSISSLEQSTG